MHWDSSVSMNLEGMNSANCALQFFPISSVFSVLNKLLKYMHLKDMHCKWWITKLFLNTGAWLRNNNVYFVEKSNSQKVILSDTGLILVPELRISQFSYLFVTGGRLFKLMGPCCVTLLHFNKPGSDLNMKNLSKKIAPILSHKLKWHSLSGEIATGRGGWAV